MISRDVIKEDDVKVIYKSQTFPTTGFGTAHNLTPELKEKIRNAFFNFEWEGTSRFRPSLRSRTKASSLR